MEVIRGKKTDIILKPNKNTFQTIMIISGTVQVDFTIPNSIRTALGFDAKIYKSGRHVSQHTMNILNFCTHKCNWVNIR